MLFGLFGKRKPDNMIWATTKVNVDDDFDEVDDDEVDDDEVDDDDTLEDYLAEVDNYTNYQVFHYLRDEGPYDPSIKYSGIEAYEPEYNEWGDCIY